MRRKIEKGFKRRGRLFHGCIFLDNAIKPCDNYVDERNFHLNLFTA